MSLRLIAVSRTPPGSRTRDIVGAEDGHDAEVHLSVEADGRRRGQRHRRAQRHPRTAQVNVDGPKPTNRCAWISISRSTKASASECSPVRVGLALPSCCCAQSVTECDQHDNLDAQPPHLMCT